MPLVIRPRPGRGLRHAVALAGAALALTAPAAAGAPPVAPADCAEPPLTQPFLGWGDERSYVLAPGQEAGSFLGDGWTLTDGASIVTTEVADGGSAQVLDMPSGATAVSPTMCVDATYPIARTMVRNVAGGEGVDFYVSYANTKTWDKPKNTGKLKGKKTGWTLSDAVKTNPGKGDEWQLARFVFVARGKKSAFQLYDFYVDPYRH